MGDRARVTHPLKGLDPQVQCQAVALCNPNACVRHWSLSVIFCSADTELDFVLMTVSAYRQYLSDSSVSSI